MIAIASIVTLDRNAIKELKIRDAYSIHKLIYSLFPGEKRTFLYYDAGGDFFGRTILVVSSDSPRIPELGTIQSKSIPENYTDHNTYAFQVKLNPVIRKSRSKTCIPVTGYDNLKEWFMNRQSRWGFAVNPDRLEISDTGLQEFTKNNQKIIHNKATYTGILEVTDKKTFTESFHKGIGRGKAFGFGLLQIRPIYN